MCPDAVLLLEGSCLKAGALALKPDVLRTLDSLYAFYHRPASGGVIVSCTASLSFARRSSTGWPCWWWRRAWLPALSSSQFENTIVVSCLDACRFYCMSLEGLSSASGCSRPPMSNASHGPLKKDAQPWCVQWLFVTLLLSEKKNL